MSKKTSSNPKDGDTEQGRASQDAEATQTQGRTRRTRSIRVPISTPLQAIDQAPPSAQQPYSPGMAPDTRESHEIFSEISELVHHFDQIRRTFDREMSKIRARIGHDVETLRKRVRSDRPFRGDNGAGSGEGN